MRFDDNDDDDQDEDEDEDEEEAWSLVAFVRYTRTERGESNPENPTAGYYLYMGGVAESVETPGDGGLTATTPMRRGAVRCGAVPQVMAMVRREKER